MTAQLRHSFVRSLLALLIVAVPCIVRSQPTSTNPSSILGGHARTGGIRFIENRGQIISTLGDLRPDILYTAEGRGLKLFFRRTGVSYLFTKVEGITPRRLSENGAPRSAGLVAIDSGVTVTTYRMDMDLVGANPGAIVTAEEEEGGTMNYYLAHCPNGITGVRGFGRVVYHDIYPEIDLIFYSNEEGLKYDFVVRPGGRASDIRMRYTGADSMRAPGDGSVVVTGPLGSITEGRPLLYQRSSTHGDVKLGETHRTKVVGSYRIGAGDEITFDVGAYDRTQSLVVDPTLIWSTFYGGSQFEYIYDIGAARFGLGQSCRYDNAGNIITAITSSSSDFPTTPGVVQVANGGGAGNNDWLIAKFTPAGALLWATYYGGAGHDVLANLDVGRSGDIVVVGFSSVAQGPTFPLSANPFCATPVQPFNEGAIVNLDPNGRRTWATYAQGGLCYDAAIDRDGNVVVVGHATSFMIGTPGTFNPTPPGAGLYTSFISRFTSGGARTWNTFAGGTSSAFTINGASAVAIDSSLNIVVAGTSSAPNFQTSPGAFQPNLAGATTDAILAKLDVTGNRIWATYVGGTDLDYGMDVAVDVHNDIVLVALTYSNDFPMAGIPFQGTFGGGTTDGTASKFTSGGNLIWSTYYGGTGEDYAGHVCIDPVNNYWIAGNTYSVDLPVTADAFQATNQDPPPVEFPDGFIVKLRENGARRWATYFGGSSLDHLAAICVNHIGAAVNGYTVGSGFPITAGAFQPNISGGPDGFLARFCDPSTPITITRPTRFCQGDSTTLSVPEGFDSYRWSTGATTRSITVTQSGRYSVTVVSLATCSGSSDTLDVQVYPVTRRSVNALPSMNICEGDSAVLGIGGGMRSYRWSTGATSPTITVGAAGRYSVTFVDTNSCTSYSDTITLGVNPRPAPAIAAIGSLTLCQGESVTLDAGSGHARYQWSTGDSLRQLKVTKSGTYGLRVMSALGCWGDAAPVTVKVLPRPSVKIDPFFPTVFCEGDSTILVATPGFAGYEWSTGDRTERVTVKRGGVYSVIAVDTSGCRDTADITIQVNPRPSPTIAASGPTRFCRGDSVVLTAANGYAQYIWATGVEARSIVVKRSGIYYVIATNDQGCPGISDTITVQVLDRPVAAIGGPSSVCKNSIATYGIPHVAGQSYDWQVNGAGGSIRSGAGTNQITVQWGPSGTGAIVLHVRNDSTGCGVDTTFTVRVGTSLTPVITADRSTSLCQGESVTLDAGVYSSYTWSTGAATRTITVSQPGDYTVAVVDAKGCSGASAPVTVQVNEPTAPAINASNNGRLCPGGTITLDAGAGYTSYRWSNGALGQQISISREGSYTVTATDTNGCSATSEAYEVTLAPAPTPAINGPVVVCRNSTIGYSTPALDGASYTWSVSGGTLSGGQGTDGITVQWGSIGEGTVELTVTTADGCTGTAEVLTVSIGDKLEPVVTPSGTVALCSGESVTLDAGAGYTSYLWSTGASTRTIVVSDPATVAVTVSDANGCSGTSAPVSVVAKERPVPVIIPDGPLDLCEGDSVMLRTSETYAGYQWTTGASTPTIKVRKSGSYGVRVTTGEGCGGEAVPVIVTVHARPAKPTIIARGSTLVVTNPLSGGSYRWCLDGAPIAGAATPVIDQFGCGAESDPYLMNGAPGTVEHKLWLDTVSATVGRRVRLVMYVDPPIIESEAVTGYRAMLHVDPRALFFHRAISAGGAVAGNSAQLRYRADGTMTVESIASGSPIVGAALFELDLEGLVTGSPLNVVMIDSVTLLGDAHASILGDGLVLLSGCEMGADFGKLVRIESIRPNPALSDVVVSYHGPAGSELRLRLTDGVGREQRVVELARGTGERQEIRVRVEGLASGVYMVELRNGGERSILPIIIKK